MCRKSSGKVTLKNGRNDNRMWLPERNRDRCPWSTFTCSGSLLRTDSSHCSALGNRLFLWKQSHPTQKLQISFISLTFHPLMFWSSKMLWHSSSPIIFTSAFVNHLRFIPLRPDVGSWCPMYLCRRGLSVLFTQTLLIAQGTAMPFSSCRGMKYWQFTEPIITLLNKILY